MSNMSDKVILTCAVTGGHNNFAKHPDYPITPEKIASDCIDAAKAGAAIVHVHVRDPETGVRSGRTDLFEQVVARVRDADVDVLINLTTSEGARFIPNDDNPDQMGEGTTLVSPLARLAHIEQLLPDICTLDMGSFNFGDAVFINTPKHLRLLAKRIQELGVKPEMEVFELGHIRFANALLEEGLIDSPPMFQLCLGIPHASPASPEVLSFMKNMLPSQANWCAFGISRFEFPIVAQAIAGGGHCRVGLEDNLYLGPGEFATNAKLVERAVAMIQNFGKTPASANEAADILAIKRRK